ncbi:kinase [Ureibacillus acetophenoni]|uniref:Uridine kinase n=1 Tax=Ureibacillus acetophenoni TaxID=614649 RepID=A0A285UP83_9BACL|nr:kinase [Ureibacillus acetophenoni]SOC43208.1 uridine kinase [Ureibacillus acetophenoni]
MGIDGLSGAGKTTLVNRLQSEMKDRCNVIVIHIDDHIVERNKRYDTGYEEWYEYYYLQWDINMLVDKLFNEIHRNSSKITLPYYEKSMDKSIDKTLLVTPESMIVIEGVFLQRKEWKSYYDFTVFIDCPREVRYERVLQRDRYIGNEQAILDKYKRRYWLGEEHYLKTVNPLKKANSIYKPTVL